MQRAIIGLALLISSTVFAAEITVASWNVKRLGSGSQQSFEALGKVASAFDVIALQEVMTVQGLNKLEAALERMSGEKWGRLESSMIGSKAYKEAYAFLYRESTVEYDEGAVVYLDRSDQFFREPFSAKFKARADHSTFALGTVHIIYGKGVSNRVPEIKALADYWLWMNEVYSGTECILVGDFNLPPNHPAWYPLKKHARPLITSGATTLSAKDGKFASLYDNIWIARDSTLFIKDVGIVNYPKMIGWDHQKSRKSASDHAPVYMTIRWNKDISNAKNLARAPKTSIIKLDTGLYGSDYKNIASSVKPALISASETGAVRGNLNSKVFHHPNCPSYNSIAFKNRIKFDSASDAKSAGYRLAGNCH